MVAFDQSYFLKENELEMHWLVVEHEKVMSVIGSQSVTVNGCRIMVLPVVARPATDRRTSRADASQPVPTILAWPLSDRAKNISLFT